jgi:hypothetical protein
MLSRDQAKALLGEETQLSEESIDWLRRAADTIARAALSTWIDKRKDASGESRHLRQGIDQRAGR